MPYSSFFRRAVALIIDMLIVSLPAMFVFAPMVALQAVVLGVTPQASATQTGLLGATVFSWQIVTLVLAWLYFAFWESGSKQSTWGKRIMGIKVVGADGGRMGFGRATARFFCKSILSPLFFQIGFIMAAFTNRKRALHDMVVETYVVKKDFEPGQELPETKTRWFWMILACALWILFSLTGGWVTSRLTLTPTQVAANKAVTRLTHLAQDGLGLRTPAREEGATYFYNEDGYRAVVVDPVSNNKFTLFIKNGATQPCCEAFPFGDCATTGYAECQ